MRDWWAATMYNAISSAASASGETEQPLAEREGATVARKAADG